MHHKSSVNTPGQRGAWRLIWNVFTDKQIGESNSTSMSTLKLFIFCSQSRGDIIKSCFYKHSHLTEEDGGHENYFLSLSMCSLTDEENWYRPRWQTYSLKPISGQQGSQRILEIQGQNEWGWGLLPSCPLWSPDGHVCLWQGSEWAIAVLTPALSLVSAFPPPLDFPSSSVPAAESRSHPRDSLWSISNPGVEVNLTVLAQREKDQTAQNGITYKKLPRSQDHKTRTYIF